MSSTHTSLPRASRITPRLSNPHERRFREMEVAFLNLIFDLGITDVGRRKQAMVMATRAIQTIRTELAALAPGKLTGGSLA